MKARPDFAEWLSPMLVKELRQGMRSRMFVFSFLILQIAMIFVALLGVTLAALHQPAEITAGFFWFIVGVPLLMLMPLSGLGSVANERKANTLELIFLTRLSARRILAGKWFALVAQSALLVCAVLPYAVLRYFFGGVNLGGEVTALVSLLLGSALLCGVAVGLSPQSSRITRPLLAIGVIFLLQSILPMMLYFFSGYGRVVSGGAGFLFTWKIALGLGVLGLLFLLYLLEFGASKIAPPAENHSSSRRLIAFGVLAIVALLSTSHFLGSLLLMPLALLALIGIGALCEPAALVASVYQPFVRRGFLGRCAGRILYPGWPSGVFFNCILLALITPIFYRYALGRIEPKWILWTCVATSGALLFPAALIRLLLPKFKHPAVIYLVLQGACGLLVIFATISQGLKQFDLRAIAAIIPTCGLILANARQIPDASYSFVLLGNSVVAIFSLVSLLFCMRRPWTQIRALEKEAMLLPDVSRNVADTRTTA